MRSLRSASGAAAAPQRQGQAEHGLTSPREPEGRKSHEPCLQQDHESGMHRLERRRPGHVEALERRERREQHQRVDLSHERVLAVVHKPRRDGFDPNAERNDLPAKRPEEHCEEQRAHGGGSDHPRDGAPFAPERHSGQDREGDGHPLGPHPAEHTEQRARADPPPAACHLDHQRPGDEEERHFHTRRAVEHHESLGGGGQDDRVPHDQRHARAAQPAERQQHEADIGNETQSLGERLHLEVGGPVRDAKQQRPDGRGRRQHTLADVVDQPMPLREVLRDAKVDVRVVDEDQRLPEPRPDQKENLKSDEGDLEHGKGLSPRQGKPV
jgi:hypothetical protein